ncbi:MAG: alanine--tRNA ligase [Anaerolineae bacterium UTCFX2]|jgi:alanyl-tRNA synthetase|nr:alanine--tRNA ligase [Anaerolineae bacterium]OQY94065.1 MAG: alanine--tRNA ligase [Anaerolineae bacterium UTCFX2]
MTSEMLTGAKIRQDFIDFFTERGHTFVPSSSLVPGGDHTLLFTNAGMVQFKDVFLGTDKRPYVRAVNSQKCMRVAGKHNDLEDVGQDDVHHTFFEMLGNWSFGDYYKKEAIAWAWQLLTEVWGLPKDKLWTTCFKDDHGDIPTDDEASSEWLKQPGIHPEHVLFFGRKDNFWEMAETGPCGPCSEIHLDLGIEHCDKQGTPGHVCGVNGDCARFLELWNLVFIQYNRLSPTSLEPLPTTHVDTGMGLDRIVSVLQGVYSNYKTDLLLPLMRAAQQMTGDSDAQMETNLTPYRVIADHARAATFLIADGVVPGNIGRNYVCRMIIRRAARFGSKLGLNRPFLAPVAEKVIEIYGDFYPELKRNRATILNNLTAEEERFQRTVESGIAKLESLFNQLEAENKRVLPGEQAFDLYATYGLPLEITRDIARERSLDVNEAEFSQALEKHRLASGAGEAFGPMGGEDVDVYRDLMKQLIASGKLPPEGVQYNPYELLEVEAPLLALVEADRSVPSAEPGAQVEVLLPETGFYVEAGGQVSDTGVIVNAAGAPWEIQVTGMRKPAAGVIVHVGKVVSGQPKVGDMAIATVDRQRRRDIMRNHTATHLLHTEIRAVLGDHARQAGSLVAPDHLRFDFTHPQALTLDQIEQIEADVNRDILGDYPLNTQVKPLQQAISEGATALFGEKYGEIVRNITIGQPEVFSNELCGGTHVQETGDIGIFLITSESSAAAGVRRIEAVTGRAAYDLVRDRFRVLKTAASLLDVSPEEASVRVRQILDAASDLQKELTELRRRQALLTFEGLLNKTEDVNGVPLLVLNLPNLDVDTLRVLTDRFRQRYSTGVVVLGSTGQDDRPIVVAALTDNLLPRGLNAVDLVRFVSGFLGGGGGGKPNLAQAGGKEAAHLPEALQKVKNWVEQKTS